jgi:hypothetical protein
MDQASWQERMRREREAIEDVAEEADGLRLRTEISEILDYSRKDLLGRYLDAAFFLDEKFPKLGKYMIERMWEAAERPKLLNVELTEVSE